MTGIEGPKVYDQKGVELPDFQDLGLFQIQAHTANSLGMGNYTREAIRDNDALNTQLATTYLQSMIDTFGSRRTGLGAYKAGETNTRNNVNNKSSGPYADNILECARRFNRSR